MQKKKAIEMNLNGALSKITSPIEKNATLIGAGLSLYQNQGWLDSISQALSGNIHAPDMPGIQADLLAPVYKTTIAAIIAGYFAADFKSIPLVSKIGKILQDGGTGYLIARLADTVTYHMTHSKVNTPESIRENFSNAPMMSALTY